MKIIVKILLGILVFLGAFLGFFTLVEYRPQDIEVLELLEARDLDKDTLSLLSYNIGYGALSKDENFFMDGGKKVRPDSREVIKDNLEGILTEIGENPADFYLIQEVDKRAKRSYGINEVDFFKEGLGLEGNYVRNFKALYVPFPLPTIGPVDSGLLNLSSYRPQVAYRKSLPVPFKWPVRTVNLKRALLVEEYGIEGSDRKFVLINLHLEAFDDGQGKIEQSRALMALAEDYYKEGHYVLVGGDWNQTFPGGEIYPQLDDNLWQAGRLLEEELPQGWSYSSDSSNPSCRSNHEAYKGPGHQVYLIDGYLLSPNLEEVSVETLDYGFTHTDHSPVKLVVRLLK